MKCSKCGAELSEGTKFCANCGTVVEEQAVQQAESVAEPVQSEPVVPEKPVEKVADNTPAPKKKKGKAGLVIAIIAIVLVIVAVILIIILTSKGKDKEAALFGADTIIKVESNDKYGFIDINGKFIINAEYDVASDFVDGYAYIGKGYSYDREYTIIDTKGKVVKTGLPKASKIKYYSDLKLWLIGNKLYDSSFKDLTPAGVTYISDESNKYFTVVVDGKDGIMDTTGKITWTYKNDDAVIYTPKNSSVVKEAYCAISDVELDQEGIINCDTGKVVREFSEDSITSRGNNVFRIRTKDGKTTDIFVAHDKIIHELGEGDYYVDHGEYGYIDISDKEYNSDGYATFNHIYIDLVKGEVVEKKPEAPAKEEKKEEIVANKDYEVVSCDNGYGLNHKDKVSIKCEWTSLKRFDVALENYLISEGKPYIMGKKDDKIYLLNMNNGKTVTVFENKDFRYGESTFVYYNDKVTNKYVIYNLVTGKQIVLDADRIYLYSNYVVVKHSNGKIDYYNAKLKPIFTTE